MSSISAAGALNELSRGMQIIMGPKRKGTKQRTCINAATAALLSNAIKEELESREQNRW